MENLKRNSFLYTLLLLLLTVAAKGQVLLNAVTHPKFVEPLPAPSVVQPVVPGGTYYEVAASQFQQNLGLKDANGNPLLTTVWGYNGSYPGPTFEMTQNVPVSVKWINNLKDNTGMPLPHLLPVDTTVHWAHPSNWPACGVPIVTHLHGGHTEAASDGYPEAWFTPDFAQTGHHFQQQIYNYSNSQEATTLWYHDHALGITRLNVYAGLAGFYILRNAWENSLNLPSGNYEIPLVIQDRMFTADGQLYYPSQPPVPTAPTPSILPEFFGDFILVNGKAWPFKNVEPRKYRLRILNGSDSRFYNLYFTDPVPITQIGTDGGLLNAPVTTTQLLIGPGERKDVILDFSNPALWNKSIILRNNASTPFPKGVNPNAKTNGMIMAFKVNVPLTAPDNSVIPATLRPAPIADPGVSTNTRQLVMTEGLDQYGRLKTMLGTSALGPLGWFDPITENPVLNAVETWEIINTTIDAHPMHLHLVNYQVINSQKFNTKAYVPGNPASLKFTGSPKAPAPGDNGLKDTYIMLPGEVTRIKAKFDLPGLYAWHCHILSHEDHEMMRAFYVGPMPPGFRTTPATESVTLSAAPNPFADYTTITLNIKQKDYYKVEVYNSVGQPLGTLTEGNLEEGTHSLNWNVKDTYSEGLMNGFYFIRVTGSVNNAIFKLVLQK